MNINAQPDNLQIAFALTTTGTDIFASMTRIAIASLRHSNPAARILVACDEISMQNLQHARNPLIEETDAWISHEVPPGSAESRNRHVKTNLRELIGGSFLFLDSDVYVRGKLDLFSRIAEDIAVAPNHSKDSPHAQLPGQDAVMIERLGWEIDSGCYFNGGVVYYNETAGARLFGATWHRRWKDSLEQLGEYRDQPALNASLLETRPQLRLLPHEYNYQFKWDADHIEAPVIWHYNYTSRNEKRTRFEALVDALHRAANLDTEQIIDMAEQFQPWSKQFHAITTDAR